MFPAAFVARGEGPAEGTAPPPVPTIVPQPEPEPQQPAVAVPAVPAQVVAPAVAGEPPLVPRLPQSTVTMQQKRFQRFDLDNDGVLNAAEVSTLVKQLGFDATPAYVTQLMSKFDVDGDGAISEGEFLPLWDFMQSHLAILDALDGVDLDGGTVASPDSALGSPPPH